MLIENLQTAESNRVVTATFKSGEMSVKVQICLSTLVKSIASKTLYPEYAEVAHIENYVIENMDRVVLNFLTTNLQEAA